MTYAQFVFLSLTHKLCMCRHAWATIGQSWHTHYWPKSTHAHACVNMHGLWAIYNTWAPLSVHRGGAPILMFEYRHQCCETWNYTVCNFQQLEGYRALTLYLYTSPFLILCERSNKGEKVGFHFFFFIISSPISSILTYLLLPSPFFLGLGAPWAKCGARGLEEELLGASKPQP